MKTEIESCPQVPVSWGELIDKITILEIKMAKLRAPGPLKNVEREYVALKEIASKIFAKQPGLVYLQKQLMLINQQLWDIEDAIRLKEAKKDFGPKFVELARSVYLANDERAVVKSKINALTNSALVEEKFYQPY